jgi:hypothetical protein
MAFFCCISGLKAALIYAEFCTADIYINVEDISQLKYALFLGKSGNL